MTDRELELVIGSLLHDVGKVIFRQGDDRRKHSASGCEYLKNEGKIDNESILHCVKYHHAEALKNASLEKDDLAYIVYIADNIASAADRRKNDSGDVGFEIQTPLQSVFNILNGNHENKYYRPIMLDAEGEINYPQVKKEAFDEHFYSQVKNAITENLHGIYWKQAYVNSLLEVLESCLTYVPSSTAKDELADISLFDHLKLTAAIASCIYQYAKEAVVTDYREAFFVHAKDFYQKKAFQIFSMDVSGIQNFIYTISSEHALKMLRSRSFYLEIMMEHLIDTILDKLNLTRANLIYSGGGHCFILVPNTKDVCLIIDEFLKDSNAWLMDNFGTALFVAGGYEACSSSELNNERKGSYSEIFRNLSGKLSKIKMQRYSAEDIIKLNQKKHKDYSRECKVCRNIGDVDSEDVCSMCNAIIGLSKNVLYGDFFSVVKEKRQGALPLPGGCFLLADTADSLRERMKYDSDYLRSYSINKSYTGIELRTKLWVGNYTNGDTFEELAKKSTGIERLGILRADVDNMGHAFVAGFNDGKEDKYATISRTATLSRQLSLFFKLQINKILKSSVYSINGNKSPVKRNATIVYSGGDDLFIVGAWNEIIELAVDIRRQFSAYVQNTLSVSAGIGVYLPKYPISAMAYEVADLEEQSKKMPKKNSVTLLPDGMEHKELFNGVTVRIPDGTYSWDIFENEVIAEKLNALDGFFSAIDAERGNSFLYHLLELIRSRDEKINMARYVYLLARLEPGQGESNERKVRYKTFSKKMYEWYQSEEDSRQLKTACNLYVYLKRSREAGENDY